jgi:hypothetical protein
MGNLALPNFRAGGAAGASSAPQASGVAPWSEKRMGEAATTGILDFKGRQSTAVLPAPEA